MRLLFEMDKKDYEHCAFTIIRDSARSIIIKENKLAMIHSLKYDFYKFPGGGIENEEDTITAMIRETREEAGLIVKMDTVKEYGYVHRIQKSSYDPTVCFIQDNYYYLCDVEEEQVSQKLDNYEQEEDFVLEFVDYELVIKKNRNVKNCPEDTLMFEREVRVIERLLEEGLLK